MSLPSILRQIAKKASHPNVLVYNIQLTKAKGQLLPAAGKHLGDGREDVFALDAPEREGKDGEGADCGNGEVMDGNVKDLGGADVGGGVEGNKEKISDGLGGKEG